MFRAVIDLAQPIHPGIPYSPNHPGFRHALLRRHGDHVRVDGTSGANDLIVMGTHTATHIDALAHISHDGQLHGGISAADDQRGGRFEKTGIHTLQPIVAPGVLFDIPSAIGVDRLPAGYAVTVRDLHLAIGGAEASVAPGSVALIRTGWAQLWDQPDAFLSHEDGVPGPDEEACLWLAQRGFAAVGSDTTAFEHIPAGEGHARLPGHRVLLVEHGIPIVEMLNLEELAAQQPAQFLVVLAPLKLVGATGSPIRPLALLT
jgi:kynurenine formamidase